MISKFFIERPVLANVLAIVIVLIGAVALYALPVAQYPNVVPPTISVTTRYPGASAETVMNTVALPIEQQVNGVEHMLYMQSTSASDGSYALTVTFNIGTDLNFAQVLVQNRVASAMAQLPQSVQAQGVTVQQKSTAILQIITLTSPDRKYDSLYLSNYATINLVNELARLPGVGNVNVFGVGQYAMRIWLDPQKLYALGLTPSDVIQAIQQQNQQVTGGQVGMPPAPADQDFQYTVNVEGRLSDPAEFANIIVKADTTQRRPDRPGEGRRPGGTGRPDLFAGVPAQRQAGRRHRHLPVARRQRAGCRQPGARQDERAVQGVPAGHDLRHPVRYHRLRKDLDRRGLQDADRGRRAGADRHPGVPAGLARHAGAGHHRAGHDHRRLRRDGGTGVHGQPVHLVRDHPGDRHRGRRRHRHRRRRGPLHRTGHEPATTPRSRR